MTGPCYSTSFEIVHLTESRDRYAVLARALVWRIGVRVQCRFSSSEGRDRLLARAGTFIRLVYNY